jgi:hypothetical protein
MRIKSVFIQKIIASMLNWVVEIQRIEHKLVVIQFEAQLSVWQFFKRRRCLIVHYLMLSDI